MPAAIYGCYKQPIYEERRKRGGMTSAFIYSFREMKRGSEGSDGRRKKRQGLSNGEDTSNTSKKGRQRWGEERESLYMFCCQCVL